MKGGSPARRSNSEAFGGEVHGGKRPPCNLEDARSIIFSRVVNSRVDTGSLDLFLA